MNREEVFVILPAYNEAGRLQPVLKRLKGLGYHNLVVVDDGSNDNTAQVARDNDIVALKHMINLGPGAATQTGMAYALSKGAKYIVTIDADGQHLPEDIDGLVRHFEEDEIDLVIGSRFKKKGNKIPWHRVFYNKVGNLVTFFLTGIYVTDSQSGLKVFSSNLASKIHISLNGYEFCTEIIKFIQQYDVKFVEHPIHVHYSRETMQKGQSLVNGFRMLGELFKKFFIHP